jgi:hypothetical protein
VERSKDNGREDACLRLDETKIAWRKIDGDVVAIDIDAGEYVSANASGGILWDELARGTTLDALANALVATYGIDTEIARRDVAVFVSTLRDRGLLLDAA